MGVAVFVVGHKNWGKSRTLSALTDGLQRYVRMGLVEFFIRRMSNDDVPDKFYRLLEKVDPSETPNLILAFCPTFGKPQARRSLEALRRKNYRLFFWVLRQNYHRTKEITRDEIAILRQFGRTEVFESGQVEDSDRGRALRAFIQATVLA